MRSRLCRRSPAAAAATPPAGGSQTHSSPQQHGGSSFSATVKLRRAPVGGGAHSRAAEEVLCTVRDKRQATRAIQVAQALLLNPGDANGQPCDAFWDTSAGTPSDVFESVLGRRGSEEWEEEFTRGCVVVEVAGADVDLTIIDLPGIIHDHPK